MTGIIAGFLIMFTACNINKPLEFNEKDAYVGFTVSNFNIDEDFTSNLKKGDGTNKSLFQIPITMASLNGKNSTVTIKTIDGEGKTGAKAGENFNLKTETLNFTSDKLVQYVELEIINLPDSLTGDLTFYVEIIEATNVKIGSDKVCTVKILDMDHPLLAILGGYITTGNCYWYKVFSWETTILKDDNDLSKVWLKNFFPRYQGANIYGIVNSDKTELRIPFGQPTWILANGEPEDFMLGWFVFYDEDGNEIVDLPDDEYDIPDGYNMVIYIDINEETGAVTMTIPPLYEFGNGNFNDGFFNIFIPYTRPDGEYDSKKPMITLIKK